ncbi:MAG: 23S rRNA (adenine(2503)-C(2))-methyltransferase RlmN [Peptococcaceae bacterium]|nr:23S rRNA (adenine(2503)-C(2))-methyltransferase RlmN [Peptococcaceae bacterium]
MFLNEDCRSQDVRSCSEEELTQLCRKYGVPDFRARQIFAGVHRQGASSWEEIPSLSVDVRDKLRGVLMFEPVKIVREQRSRDGTAKYLLNLADGEFIETVLVPDFATGRRTLCLSTQVGCPVGCAFCATGQEGFRRNLKAGEIVGQALEVVRAEKQGCAGRKGDAGFRINNVVFMGMGEPFLNTMMVMRAVDLLNAERGLNIGRRKMTISTCGVAPGIKLLADNNDQMGLAVSLHSSFDETRDRLVPMNKKYPLAVLMKVCREYCHVTRRRITFEMALTRETCTEQEAYALTKLLSERSSLDTESGSRRGSSARRGMIAHVNLIPVNPVVVSDPDLARTASSQVESAQAVRACCQRPTQESVSRFIAILTKARVPVSLREEKGVDIGAACGQLRRSAMHGE